jgi:hypothetical protein
MYLGLRFSSINFSDRTVKHGDRSLRETSVYEGKRSQSTPLFFHHLIPICQAMCFLLPW